MFYQWSGSASHLWCHVWCHVWHHVYWSTSHLTKTYLDFALIISRLTINLILGEDNANSTIYVPPRHVLLFASCLLHTGQQSRYPSSLLRFPRMFVSIVRVIPPLCSIIANHIPTSAASVYCISLQFIIFIQLWFPLRFRQLRHFRDRNPLTALQSWGGHIGVAVKPPSEKR